MSLVSETFRCMFQTSRFIESEISEISIEEVSFFSFMKMVVFMYTGQLDLKDDEHVPRNNNGDLHNLLDILSVADRFIVDRLKHLCEYHLTKLVDSDTVHVLLEESKLHNANQLEEICLHFLRNNDNCAFFNESAWDRCHR